MLLMREWVLLLPHDRARHMRKVCLSRARKREQPAELLRLLGRFLVRIRVLLEALDAVLHLWPPETRKQDACVVARDVHHRRVESQVAVLRQYTGLEQ